jgi:hypothetical protein
MFIVQEDGFIVVHRIIDYIQKSAITVRQAQIFIVRTLS